MLSSLYTYRKNALNCAGSAEDLLHQTGDGVAWQEAREEDRGRAGEGRQRFRLAGGEGEQAFTGDLFGGLRALEEVLSAAGDLAERRLGGAGAQRADVDAERADLRRERLAEKAVKGLGGRVGGHVRHGLEGRGGGDDHDVAAAALDHARQKQVRQVNDGGAVEIDHLAVPAWGAFFKFPKIAEAGVVDEDVDGQ